MPSIQFYILATTQKPQALRFLCQQIEQRYRAGQSVFVYTQSLAAANSFNQLLWTYHDVSFVPHRVLNNQSSDAAPVEIGYENALGTAQVLVNLANEPPAAYSDFPELIDFVYTDPDAQAHARTRYSLYRKAGFPIKNHPLKVNDL